MQTRIIMFLLLACLMSTTKGLAKVQICDLPLVPKTQICTFTPQAETAKRKWYQGQWRRLNSKAKNYKKLTITPLKNGRIRIRQLSANKKMTKVWIGKQQGRGNNKKIVVRNQRIIKNKFTLTFHLGKRKNLVMTKTPIGPRGKKEVIRFKRIKPSNNSNPEASLPEREDSGVDIGGILKDLKDILSKENEEDPTEEEDNSIEEEESEESHNNNEVAPTPREREDGLGNLKLSILNTTANEDFIARLSNEQFTTEIVADKQEGLQAFTFRYVPTGQYMLNIKPKSGDLPLEDIKVKVGVTIQSLFDVIPVQIQDVEDLHISLEIK